MSAPLAWLITYGDRLDHHCVVLDREKAMQTAAKLHGHLTPLVPADGYEAPRPIDPAAGLAR